MVLMVIDVNPLVSHMILVLIMVSTQDLDVSAICLYFWLRQTHTGLVHRPLDWFTDMLDCSVHTLDWLKWTTFDRCTAQKLP